MSSEFGQLLSRLVTQYGGGKQDLAKAIGVTPSTFSRMLAGQVPQKHTTDLCLRLAHVTKTSASKALRAAGKAAIADLLEDLYGYPARHRPRGGGGHVSPLEEQFLYKYRSLKPADRKAIAVILSDLPRAANHPSSPAALPSPRSSRSSTSSRR